MIKQILIQFLKIYKRMKNPSILSLSFTKIIPLRSQQFPARLYDQASPENLNQRLQLVKAQRERERAR
uniref:Uncharacterized protein n=1 Tax=Rhizophora mucronata TaxID=61149 RepID=A0A2P2M3N4_RHIMU